MNVWYLSAFSIRRRFQFTEIVANSSVCPTHTLLRTVLTLMKVPDLMYQKTQLQAFHATNIACHTVYTIIQV